MGSRRRLALTLLVLTGAGCAPKPASPPTEATNPNLRISLAVTPAPPRQMEPAAFTVHLADAKGGPVAGASVRVSLAMPTMDMGRNGAVLHPAGPGVYTGAGRFSMPGAWQVSVSATKGAARASRTFPVEVQ